VVMRYLLSLRGAKRRSNLLRGDYFAALAMTAFSNADTLKR
jgi:hypothetical protein